MKKKALLVLALLLTLAASSLSWADTTATVTKVTLAVEPHYSASFVLQNDNAIYLSGKKGKESYVVKYDNNLKLQWQLKLSTQPQKADLYGGYIYAVSDKSLFKIGLDGTLIWEKSFNTGSKEYDPVDITIVGNQVFTSGLALPSSGGYVLHAFTTLCTTDGGSVTTHEFNESTNSGRSSGYNNGSFYVEIADHKFISTVDNKSFKDVSETEFNQKYVNDQRMSSQWFAGPTEKPGVSQLMSISGIEIETTYIPAKLYSCVLLADNSILGIGIDSNYNTLGFMRTSKLSLPSTANDIAKPINIPTTALQNITDKDSLTSSLEKIHNDYFANTDARGESADLIALYSEQAIAKLSVYHIASEMPISSVDLAPTLSAQNELYDYVTSLNDAANLFRMRQVKSYLTLKTEKEDATLTLSSDLATLKCDGIIISTPLMDLKLDQHALASLKSKENLILTFTKEGTKPGVTFNRILDMPVIIALPKTTGSIDTTSIFNSKDQNIGGKYNPVTGMFETRIKTGDTFTVKSGAKNFTDLGLQNNKVKEAISVLAAKGIMGGKSETSFSPDSPITRAEIAATLLNLTCLLEEKGQPEFADVKPSDWYYNIAYSAKKNGIMKGTNTTDFSPKVLINKEQLLTILSLKLQEDMGYVNNSTFSYFDYFADTNLVSSWAQPHFAFAIQEGFLVNFRYRNLDPKSNLTRGETAQLIYAFYKKFW